MFACVGSNPTVNNYKILNIKRVGAEEACCAHNAKVPGSKPGLAIWFLTAILIIAFLARGRRFKSCPNLRLGSSVVERVRLMEPVSFKIENFPKKILYLHNNLFIYQININNLIYIYLQNGRTTCRKPSTKL